MGHEKRGAEGGLSSAGPLKRQPIGIRTVIPQGT